MCFIAVCMYRLVMISTDLPETTKKTHWKSETKFSPTQNLRIFFFFWTIFFPKKKKKFSDFVLDQILSWTEYCLGLHTAVVFRMQSFK